MKLHVHALALFSLLSACAAAEEPARVEVPLVVDASAATTVTTNLDYEVELTEARLAARDFRFATAGELHARRSRLTLASRALAHPGHHQVGDVTGELLGSFVVDLLEDGSALGVATLLTAKYASASFVFARAESVPGDDPLLGHTAILGVRATSAGRSVDVTFVLDSPEDRELSGAPCEAEITEALGGVIGLRLATFDPLGGKRLFDDLDFFALDPGELGAAHVSATSTEPEAISAYQTLLRRFQTHDHFSFHFEPDPPS